MKTRLLLLKQQKDQRYHLYVWILRKLFLSSRIKKMDNIIGVEKKIKAYYHVKQQKGKKKSVLGYFL